MGSRITLCVLAAVALQVVSAPPQKPPLNAASDRAEELRVLQSEMRDSFCSKDKRDQSNLLNEETFAAVDSLFSNIVAHVDACDSVTRLSLNMESPRDLESVKQTQLYLFRRAQAEMARASQLMSRSLKDLPDSLANTKVAADAAAKAAERTAAAIRKEYYALKEADSAKNKK